MLMLFRRLLVPFVAHIFICVVLAIDFSRNENCNSVLNSFVLEGNVSDPLFWTKLSHQFSRYGCLQSAVASIQISRRPVST